ncbi:hypothetical protein AVP41_02820 [Microbacterium sp. TNHR37B]|nr:hypothetical protein AVP41_02820 [Microbacterium sp. TNHR37B]
MRTSVAALSIVLYNGVFIWGASIFGTTPGATVWDVVSAPFWMPVLYSVANPWYALPLVLFVALYLAVTMARAEILARRGLHVLLAAVSAALSMGVAVAVAELTRDETFIWSHGFGLVACLRFALGAALAVLISHLIFSGRGFSRAPRARTATTAK